MSNALSFTAAGAGARARFAALLSASATTAPAGSSLQQVLPRPLMGLVAIGLCVLVVWVVRRAANPRKLSLASTPGRANSISPLHIIMLLLLWRVLGPYLIGTLVPEAHRLAGDAAIRLAWLAGSLAVAATAFRFGLLSGLGLNMRHPLYDTGRGVVGYLGVLPVCWIVHVAMLWLLPPGAVRKHEMLELLPNVSRAQQGVIIFSAVVLAPLSEEVFFRGLFQSMLRSYTQRPWAAVLVTAAFFAVVHLPSVQDVPSIFALGVALGYNYERCGRLYPSILMHALFNAVYLAIALSSG